MFDNLAFRPILLNAGLSVHHADWNWQQVSSPFARLYMVKTGTAKILMVGTELVIRPGHLYLIPPFTLHGYECDGYFELYYFHIYEDPSARVRVLEEYNMPSAVLSSELDKALVERLLEINPGRELPRYDPTSYDNPASLLNFIRINKMNPVHVSIETTGLLDILMSRFMAGAQLKTAISDNRIRKVLSHIRKNIGREIPVDELAGLCYLSNDHFIRLFKKELGQTPVQYINTRRMESAQLLLATTDMPVKNIAHMLSYNNLSYFNRLFRKSTGLTPVEYRKGQ